MTNFNLFQKIKDLNFSENLFPVIHLLENNLERVEFVKDRGQFKNFLFLAEEQVEEKIENSFIILDKKRNNIIQEESSNSPDTFEIYDLEQMYLDVQEYFKTTNELLFVEIGFNECILTSEDKFEAWELLRSKKCDDIYEAELNAKRFPAWYNVRSSKEILDEIYYMEKAEEIDEYLLYQLKEDLFKNINLSLKDNNKDCFYKSSALYIKVCEEIKNKLPL